MTNIMSTINNFYMGLYIILVNEAGAFVGTISFIGLNLLAIALIALFIYISLLPLFVLINVNRAAKAQAEYFERMNRQIRRKAKRNRNNF